MARSSICNTQRAALGRTVAVIGAEADLLSARPPGAADFLELRLDALRPAIDRLEREIRKFNVPLIVTARHPREGGLHHLGPVQRGELLLRFLNYATYLDIELRALRELATVRRRARAQDVRLIISVHDLRDTPPISSLRRKAHRAAEASADIFKVVTRTDTSEQVDRLFAFFDAPDVDLPISAMGFGRFGRITRLELAARGSVLNYAHLGQAQLPGQFSLAEWKRVAGYLRRAPR